MYAIGDAAEYAEKPLPPIAQVAKQQGYHLANLMNKLTIYPRNEWEDRLVNSMDNFAYSSRGMMAYVGGYKAAVSVGSDSSNSFRHRLTTLTGIKAWLFWRSAYFTMLRSIPNQILVPMFWFKAWVFGRDFTRF